MNTDTGHGPDTGRPRPPTRRGLAVSALAGLAADPWVAVIPAVAAVAAAAAAATGVWWTFGGAPDPLTGRAGAPVGVAVAVLVILCADVAVAVAAHLRMDGHTPTVGKVAATTVRRLPHTAAWAVVAAVAHLAARRAWRQGRRTGAIVRRAGFAGATSLVIPHIAAEAAWPYRAVKATAGAAGRTVAVTAATAALNAAAWVAEIAAVAFAVAAYIGADPTHAAAAALVATAAAGARTLSTYIRVATHRHATGRPVPRIAQRQLDLLTAGHTSR